MIERSIAFGPGGGLVGTLCLPDAAAPRAAVGQILFNAGMVHRVGPHRLNVRLARMLAREGIPSLRFDLSGQGDSARPAGSAPFEEQAVADLRAAMDALGEASGAAGFSVFGFCSGGVHGFAAAQADARVAGLLMYDTFLYRTPVARLNRYRLRIRHRGLVRTVAGWAARALSPRPSAAVRAGLGQFPIPSRERFAEVVKSLHARGTRVGVMTSGSFLELYNYRDQFRDAFRDLGIVDKVSVDFMPAMGHNATPLADQAAFMRRIADWTLDLDRARRGNARA